MIIELRKSKQLYDDTLESFYLPMIAIQISKGAKIRNRYNQAPHLTQDTNGKVTNSQLDTTNESQEVSPFPFGKHQNTSKIYEGLQLVYQLFAITASMQRLISKTPIC